MKRGTLIDKLLILILIILISLNVVVAYSGSSSGTSGTGDDGSLGGDGEGSGAGNGICDPGETCATVPQDCGVCPPPCGDVICDTALGESCNTCPSDCKSSNFGQPCNCGPCGCGGTFDACGICSGPDPTPPGYGNSCDCNSNGCGSFQCDGTCKNAPPPPCNPTGTTCNCNSCGCGTLDVCGNCNNVPTVPLNYGQQCNCNCNNQCGTIDCSGNCINAPTPCSVGGGINLVATLDGSSISTTINGEYYKDGVGPTPVNNVPVPQYNLRTDQGLYTLVYTSGGPSSARFIGISPSSSQFLPAGGSITFSFDFQSPKGTININARTSDGNSWSGSLSGNFCSTTGASCTPTTPVTVNVPLTANDVLANLRYVLSYTGGGPSGTTFAGITPSSNQFLGDGSTVTYNYNFNCNSAKGQSCTRCGSIDCFGVCSNQGTCDPGTTQCKQTTQRKRGVTVVVSNKYQSCSGACAWQNSGTDADGDGFDLQCGDGFCDINASFIDVNRTCTPGQTRCVAGRYQTCPSCDWKNSGTDADGDGVDQQCGDSLCDNNPSVTDSTAPCTSGARCINGGYQDCVNCAWVSGGTDADGDGVDKECGDATCDNSYGVCNVATPPNCIAKTATELACSDGLDNDCDTFTDCNDFNCNGTILGMVQKTNQEPISSAKIDAKVNLTTIRRASTNSSGNYKMGIICGNYNLIASHANYIPQARSISVPPRQNVTAGFILEKGSQCESDCTYLNDDTVHAECDGINDCSFCDERAKEVCDLSQPGWVRDYSDTQYVVCSKGCPQPKIETAASATCESGTLVKVTRIVVYNGRPVKLVVATCG